MPTARTLLRDRLLAGRTVAVWGGCQAVTAACETLGARVVALPSGDDEEALAGAAAALGTVEVLVADVAGAFAEQAVAPADELAGLRAGLDGAWAVARAVATARWIADEDPGGKLVLLAPRPGAGPHAEATRAAVENMARTLSIEWSRYGIRTTAVTPGAATGDDALAALVAYLASPAGDYFSGCRLDLR